MNRLSKNVKMRRCSICREEGHNKTKCNKSNEILHYNIPKASKEKKTIKDISYDIDDDTLLTIEWRRCLSFVSESKTISQMEYYVRMGCDNDVKSLVEKESKTFGTRVENIIKEMFMLGDRTSSQNDGTRNDKKIEIKSARYWVGKDDCRWQHIETEHDYDYVLFVLLDFTGFKVWCIDKQTLIGDMIEKKILCLQGEQGYWAWKSDLMPYLTEIKTIRDLDNYINA